MGGGSSVPCCCSGLEVVDDASETIIPIPDQNHRHHNLEIVSRTNHLLNRWTQSEVSALKVSYVVDGSLLICSCEIETLEFALIYH